MSLTVTRTGDWQYIAGNRRVANVVVAFDSSYPTGGETFSPSDVGMRVIEAVRITPNYGYSFDYDYTNSTIRVYRDQSIGMVTVNTSAIGNTTTGSDFTLKSFTVPANTISAQNMGIRATVWGQTSSTAGTLKAKFGTAVSPIELISSLISSGSGQFRGVYDIYRVTSVLMSTCAQHVWTSGTVVTADVEFRAVTTADFTSDCPFIFTAVGTAGVVGSTITANGLTLEYIGSPAASTTGAAGLEVGPTTDLSGLTDIRVSVTGY